MEQEPLITIVVPVYNRATIVSRTLLSIAEQTYRPLHVILVDNGSTDHTLEILTKWHDSLTSSDFLIDILQEPEKGVCAARNKGLSKVTSPYVMFFDSDDEMRPWHISNVIKYLEANPDTDLLHWNSAIIDNDGWLNVKSHTDTDLLRCHIFHGTLATQRFAVRTELLRKVGGWNDILPIWNDYELGVRLLTAPDIRIRQLYDEPPVIIHISDDSITGTNFSSSASMRERALDIIDDTLTDTAHTHHLHYTLARRAILAAHYKREGANQDALRLLQILNQKSSRIDLLKLKVTYLTERILGHGGSAIATYLFRESSEKQHKNWLNIVNQSTKMVK